MSSQSYLGNSFFSTASQRHCHKEPGHRQHPRTCYWRYLVFLIRVRYWLVSIQNIVAPFWLIHGYLFIFFMGGGGWVTKGSKVLHQYDPTIKTLNLSLWFHAKNTLRSNTHFFFLFSFSSAIWCSLKYHVLENAIGKEGGTQEKINGWSFLGFIKVRTLQCFLFVSL